MAHRDRRTSLCHLREHLVCVLCGGYLIDATTIVECLHSFCKTCIVRYLDSSKFCPICDVQVHKTKPLVNIRMDHTLQDMVYKLVPGLFQEEMKRRREFYKEKIDDEENDGPWPEYYIDDDGEVQRERVIFSDDEQISLCLQLSADGKPPKSPDKRDIKGSNEMTDCRYLLCPAAVTVSHLKKFIRLKFNLCDRYQIDVYHSDEALMEHFTLIDIAYIYAWRRKGPLRLFYTVYTNPAKKLKRSASSTVSSEISKDTSIVEMPCNSQKTENTEQSVKSMSVNKMENQSRTENTENSIIKPESHTEKSIAKTESMSKTGVVPISSEQPQSKKEDKMTCSLITVTDNTTKDMRAQVSSTQKEIEPQTSSTQKEHKPPVSVLQNDSKPHVTSTHKEEKAVVSSTNKEPKSHVSSTLNPVQPQSSIKDVKEVEKEKTKRMDLPKKTELSSSCPPTINVPSPSRSLLYGLKSREKEGKRLNDLSKPKDKILSLPVRVPEPPLSVPQPKQYENVSKTVTVPRPPGLTFTHNKSAIQNRIVSSNGNKSAISANSSNGKFINLNHEKQNGEKRSIIDSTTSSDAKKVKYSADSTSKSVSYKNGRDNHQIARSVSVPYIAKSPVSPISPSFSSADKARKLLQVPERPYYVPFAHGQGINIFPYRAHIQDYGNDIPQDLSMKKKPSEVVEKPKSSEEKKTNGIPDKNKNGEIDKYAFTDDDDTPVTSRKLQHVKSEPVSLN